MPLLKRIALVLLVLLTLAAFGLYFFNRYWVQRFDPLIARQAAVYRLDPDLVWSIIHEETYFRPWMVGEDGEIGLMQVTPAVGREWAAETGMRELSEQMRRDPASLLADPERNIQIGCWYLEKIWKDYRDQPGAEARVARRLQRRPLARRRVEPPRPRQPVLHRRTVRRTHRHPLHPRLRLEHPRTLPGEEGRKQWAAGSRQ